MHVKSKGLYLILIINFFSWVTYKSCLLSLVSVRLDEMSTKVILKFYLVSSITFMYHCFWKYNFDYFSDWQNNSGLFFLIRILLYYLLKLSMEIGVSTMLLHTEFLKVYIITNFFDTFCVVITLYNKCKLTYVIII